MSKFDFVTPDGYRSMREIREELLSPESWGGYTMTEGTVDAILEMFWFRDSYSSFIAKEDIYPQFLDFLRKFENKTFKRIDFYDYLYAGDPLYDQIKDLSYVIEKRMNNDFTLEEFAKVESDLKLSKEELLKSGILITENNLIGISHHTISEYFVAYDLLSNENSLDRFKEYSVIDVNQTGEQFFNPSWYGVAHFLLDTDFAPELMQFFTDLAEVNKKIVDQNYSEVLSHSNFERINPDLKRKLFNQIYVGAKISGVWISEWAVSGLANLFVEQDIQTLESDLISEPKEFPDIVSTSNVVAIMGELLEQKRITNKSTLKKWKEIFIKYANQEFGSGVLQRRSLKALENFQEEEVVELVKSSFDFGRAGIKEQFVQEAFLRLCYEVAPNSDTTLEYITKGFSTQASAYSWFGLQKITSEVSILAFIKKLLEDEKLLEKFLHDENIFLKAEDDEEKPFIKSLRVAFDTNKQNELIKASVELIRKSCDMERYDLSDIKSFIPTLLKIAFEHKPSLYVDLLTSPPGNRRNRDHYSLTRLLGLSTNSSNYADIYEYIKENKVEILENYVYSIPDLGLKNELLTKIHKPLVVPVDWDEEEAKAKQKTIETFKYKLEPVPKQYMTDVFAFYLKHEKEIGELDQDDRKRLLYLAYEDGIARLDPNDFTLKINKYTEGKNFTWSRQAQFYGDMIRVVYRLEPELLTKCKQHLVDFIPFAFSDDLSTILEVVDDISDDELVDINKAFVDTENDRRYLNTNSYVTFVERAKKNGSRIISPKAVLKSFIGDDKISDYEQRSALEALELFSDEADDDFHEFLKYIEHGETKALERVANSILIRKYSDVDSIKWRFAELKKLARPVAPHVSGEVYNVDFPEDEYIDKSFASPLIAIKDPTIADQFLDLLTFAHDFSKTKNSEAYVEYVNSLTLSYFESIACQKNYAHFLELEELMDKLDSIFWRYHLPVLRIKYLAQEEI